MDENQNRRVVVNTHVAVNKKLGSGLLEPVCKVIVAWELRERGLEVDRQLPAGLVKGIAESRESLCALGVLAR